MRNACLTGFRKTRIFWGFMIIMCAFVMLNVNTVFANCSCVDYVSRKIGVSCNGYWSAKDYGSCLIGSGFRRIIDPRPGAVIILQPNVLGADRVEGHIGFVGQVVYQVIRNGQRSYGLNSVRGANQGCGDSGCFTDANCGNVSESRYFSYSIGQKPPGVEFYSR